MEGRVGVDEEEKGKALEEAERLGVAVVIGEVVVGARDSSSSSSGLWTCWRFWEVEKERRRRRSNDFLPLSTKEVEGNLLLPVEEASCCCRTEGTGPLGIPF
jgi:hypothetical protein